MLAHDFAQGGSPVRFLRRIAEVCLASHTQLVLAYVPFGGVVDSRYAPALVKLGMAPEIAAALHRDPAFRRQNQVLAALSRELNVPFADATEDLERAERNGTPQYWMFDTHPQPSGYRTIADRIYQTLRGGPR